MLLNHRLLGVSLLTFVLGFGVSRPASALDFTLNWTGTDAFGNGISSLTGTFTGTDLNSDGIIRGGTLFGANEVTAFNVSFTNANPGSVSLISYNLGQLQSFSPAFNFNYDITSSTVLQSGNAGDNNGFAIGDNSGYLLDTTLGSGITFTDFANSAADDAGGTLTATPVPFEFSPTLGLLALGGWFGRKKVANKIKAWRG
ncbi:hypothetical protein VB711_13340 [Cronbergia sp. UHCC 0137]|uniref:PFE-CTERM domain-containing protein n=1 Tax=Cronbergia sp. UHCC 0137 TaxID=3110239 RepID=UPI002B21A428|nr:hypothetical protein [Cronbergia sp. UHCC 0137]MEA5618815.1 hypothetical protein [Cronbergia sp. UHCC 0137]